MNSSLAPNEINHIQEHALDSLPLEECCIVLGITRKDGKEQPWLALDKDDARVLFLLLTKPVREGLGAPWEFSEPLRQLKVWVEAQMKYMGSR